MLTRRGLGRPVYVAVVDTTCDDDFLELVRNTLLSALLAIGPHALFGLVTISSRVSMWDLQGTVPAVRHVTVAARQSVADGVTIMPLADALPLEARTRARRGLFLLLSAVCHRAGISGGREQVA